MENNIEPMMVENIPEVQESKSFQNTWNDIQPIKYPTIGYIFKTHNLSKMMMFIDSSNFSLYDMKDILDFHTNPLNRKENEDYKDYKIRRKFQDALLKYRKEVKAVIINKLMKAQVSKVEEEKEKFESSLEK